MIKISYNDDEEMMHIENDKGTVFLGNYWDFPREPPKVAEFLRKLGIEVKIDKDFPSIG